MYKVYNIGMKTISLTNARKNISNMIDEVRETGQIFAIGRHDNLEVVMLKYPREYNKAFSDIANVNAYSSSFDFLTTEPELYSVSDLKKSYV